MITVLTIICCCELFAICITCWGTPACTSCSVLPAWIICGANPLIACEPPRTCKTCDPFCSIDDPHCITCEPPLYLLSSQKLRYRRRDILRHICDCRIEQTHDVTTGSCWRVQYLWRHIHTWSWRHVVAITAWSNAVLREHVIIWDREIWVSCEVLRFVCGTADIHWIRQRGLRRCHRNEWSF